MPILENHQAQPKALHPAPVPHKVTPVADQLAEPWMYLGLHRAQRNEREERVSTVAQAARQEVDRVIGVVPREELTERLDVVLSSESAFVPSVRRLRARQLLPRYVTMLLANLLMKWMG